jgi:lysophospholipase L1-like esterase
VSERAEEKGSARSTEASRSARTDRRRPARSTARGRLAKLGTLLFTLAVCFGIIEGVFRCVESRAHAHDYHRGTGGLWERDSRWGWRMSKGAFEAGTLEFQVTGDVNALAMNDEPFDADADRDKTRVLSLGDSHTFAVGVSMNDTWPKALQTSLNAQHGTKSVRVYNAGCSGYNLHQYLLRLIDQGPTVKPHYVVVGFSFATDLYDLLPPDRGGWIYGWADQPRDYFDFDESGALVERHWAPQGAVVSSADSSSVRRTLDHLATFRYLRRTRLALAIGSRVKVGGQSLWPNMEVVLEKDVAPNHEYQWKLAKALILRMKAEAERLGAKLVVVGIPYLPQVYDEIWESTFGRDPRFDRRAGNDRLKAFLADSGIAYVETLDAFREKQKQVGRWLHFRDDAHPTAEGQKVIADAIVESRVIATSP